MKIQFGANEIAVNPEMTENGTEIEIQFDTLARKISISQVKPYVRDGITGSKKVATLLGEKFLPKIVFYSPNTRLKIFVSKFSLRDFYYFNHYESNLLLISHSAEWCPDCSILQKTSASGFYSSDVQLNFPTDNVTYYEYLYGSKMVLIQGIAYFFGGLGGAFDFIFQKENLKKIAYLDGCEVKEHEARLTIQIDSTSSAVGFENGGQSVALLCFESFYDIGDSYDSGTYKKCEIFDGSIVEPSSETRYSHRSACLGQLLESLLEK